MTDPGEAEELLAQALRAQARNAPQAVSTGSASIDDSEELASEPGELPDFRSRHDEVEPVRQAESPPIKPLVREGLTDQLPLHYGLLSGTGASSLAREHAALGDTPPPAELAAPPENKIRQTQLATRWILLLVIVLGLAAGSVMGLLTLL